MNIAELAQLAELHQLQHERSLLELLDGLRDIDPEVAERAVEVFDDKTSAPAGSPAPSGPWAASRPCRRSRKGNARTCCACFIRSCMASMDRGTGQVMLGTVGEFRMFGLTLPGIESASDPASLVCLPVDTASAQARKLMQTQAGERMGISQPEVSRLFKGNFREYSVVSQFE